jgi:hypothetical protein
MDFAAQFHQTPLQYVQQQISFLGRHLQVHGVSFL